MVRGMMVSRPNEAKQKHFGSLVKQHSPSTCSSMEEVESKRLLHDKQAFLSIVKLIENVCS